ncbi:unnamed protein product [Effrenium voratum]|nr:unnamed protein product [Effrenium voratum]
MSSRFGKSGTLAATSSSILWGNTRQKALQKMSSAVGIPFDHIRKASVEPTRRELSPSQRFRATAYDSDWKLRPELTEPRPAQQETHAYQQSRDDCDQWLQNVLGKRKRTQASTLSANASSGSRQDLTSSLLKAVASDFQRDWDPLRDLKIQGPKESPPESRSSVSSEDLDISSLALVARLGRRRSTMRDSKARRSSRVPTMKRDTPKEAPKAAEVLTLQSLSGKLSIPFQVSQQAFGWWFQYADSGRNQGLTEAAILEGKHFDMPSLGGMSQKAFIQTCCAISDVETPEQLDMEFVGALIASDESERQLDFEEFLTFFHKFCFSEEVLISRQERELRRLARKHGISFLDIDWLKKEFDKADRKCEGKLRQDEFHSLMAQLMKLPAGQELPDKKKKELWIAATQGWRKVLDLDAFLAFYVTFV